jgi:predicted nucleotidyltransferase
MSLTDERAETTQLPRGLLDNIVTHLNPQKIILFGSRVTGNTHADSDWDLFVIVDDDTTQEQVNWRVMGKVRQGIRGAVDIIPYPQSAFRERSKVKGSLAWIAANKGQVVYERPEAA